VLVFLPLASAEQPTADSEKTSTRKPETQAIEWCGTDCGSGTRIDFENRSTEPALSASLDEPANADTSGKPLSPEERAALEREFKEVQRRQQEKYVTDAAEMLIIVLQTYSRQAAEWAHRVSKGSPLMKRDRTLPQKGIIELLRERKTRSKATKRTKDTKPEL